MDFYIVDLRIEWARRLPYVSLWRPDDKGYCYPLPWAGRYSLERIHAYPTYYASKSGRTAYQRWPVSCDVVEALAEAKPRPGVIDGNVGPVLPNVKHIRDALRRAAYIPKRALTDA